MSARLRLAALPLLTAALLACSTSVEQPQTAAVAEIRPGILQGYLPMDDLVESVTFVPPPPEPGSARQALDDAIAASTLALQGSTRWELATQDAHLGFPAAADAFSCTLGIGINEQDTPALYLLLRRTLADLGLATYSAKNAYQRQRPFMLNHAPICTPEEEDMLRHDGSYPSGHTAIGWGWGLILSQLDPGNGEALVARGRSFGESRKVCNVHWHSDVVAGRMVAAAAVARLQTSAEFRAALGAAAADIASAREQGLPPNRDCGAEEAALATRLP